MKFSITIIGLGQMGRAINDRLKYYYTLHGYDLQDLDYNKIKLDADEIVILCLPNSEVVAEVVKRILELYKPKFILDHTTNSPEAVVSFYDICRRQDVNYIECPMIGGVRSARQGKLTVVACKDIRKYIRITNCIKKYTAKVIDVEDLPSLPSKLKILHNLVTISNSAIFLEILSFAKTLGIGILKFFEVIQSGTASSYIANNTLVRTLLENNFEDGFKLYLASKDIKYGRKLASLNAVKLSMLEIVENYIDRAMQNSQTHNLDYPIIHESINQQVIQER